jgi:hypothetical protein
MSDFCLVASKNEELIETFIKKGIYIMGGVSDWVATLAVLSLIRAWDAAEEARKSRQEEMFVPFNLPPLPQQEQPMCQYAVAVAGMTSASHAPATR